MLILGCIGVGMLGLALLMGAIERRHDRRCRDKQLSAMHGELAVLHRETARLARKLGHPI